MSKKKKQTLTSDGVIDTDDWTLGGGELNVGTVSFTGGTLDNSLTLDSPSLDVSYDQMAFAFDEEELRKKYPALKDAYEHYQNVLDMCRTREKEEDEN
tara:strand:- start:250 stop:543 length:294 start_codon:yes stop_codon:yes gene_type:complete